MSRFNTGNPIGSADPRDRDDNSKNLDEAVNDLNSDTWIDRFGVERKTWSSIEKGIEEQLIAGGRIFDSEEQGRAAVENDQYYYAVSDDPNVSKTLWKRVSATESEFIADDPSGEYVKNASTNIDLFFDDVITFDPESREVIFPSGMAISNLNPSIKPFERTTLTAPATRSRASYYYFDFDSETPFVMFEGSGVSQPTQTGSLEKIGSLWNDIWKGSHHPIRYAGQPRQVKSWLKNIINNGGGDPRLDNNNVSLYGDSRPTSVDNSTFQPAPVALTSHGVQQAIKIERGGALWGNFLQYELGLGSKAGANILIAMFVHATDGVWDFGNTGPYYYLSALDENGFASFVERGQLHLLHELSDTVRVYGRSWVPVVEEGYRPNQIMFGVRAGSETQDFWFGGFWISKSAGLSAPLGGLAPSLYETFFPDFSAVDVPVAPREGAAEPASSGIESLIDSMTNPLRSMQVRLIGDSITWGTGASGNSNSGPRDGLNSPRNNLSARSYANLLRDYLGNLACGVLKERVDLGGGGSEDSRIAHVPPVNPGTRYIHPVTGRELTPAKSESESIAGNVYHGYVVDIREGDSYNYNSNIEIDIVGDNIQFVFSQLIGDSENNYIDVYLDGVLYGSFSFLGGSSSYGVESEVFTFPFGKHAITLKRIGIDGSPGFRFEGIKVEQKIRFFNDGLIGTGTNGWMPPNGYLPQVIQEGDEVYYLALGTNNRGADRPNRKFFVDQYRSIIDFLLENNKKIILSASCVATEGNESSDSYDVHMNEIASDIQKLADEYKLDFINQYAYTLQHYLDGEDILPDGLHPNDDGHRIMFNNIKGVLIAESQKSRVNT